MTDQLSADTEPKNLLSALIELRHARDRIARLTPYVAVADGASRAAEAAEAERDQLRQVLHLLRYGMARAKRTELAAVYITDLIDRTTAMVTGRALEPCDRDEQYARAERAEAERDGAYRERAQLLALLAALHPSVIAPAPDIDEDGWQILYLRIGGRQASWHIAPRDADLYAHVERVPADDRRAQWDGHTTEQKYAHIGQHAARLYAEARGRVETPLTAAEVAVERVRALYEQWVKAGVPLGTSVARWRDARLVELRTAVDDSGPAAPEPNLGAESLVDVKSFVDEDGEPLCVCTYGERCPNCRD